MEAISDHGRDDSNTLLHIMAIASMFPPSDLGTISPSGMGLEWTGDHETHRAQSEGRV